MIGRLALMVLSVVFLSPSLLPAQSRELFGRSPPLADPVSGSRETSTDKMYEDIEIFRRILDGKLNPYYPLHIVEGTGGMAGMQGGMMGMRGGMMGGGMQNPMPNQPPTGNMVSFPIPQTHRESSHSLEGVYLEGHGIVDTATLASLHPRGKTDSAPSAPVEVDEWESARRKVRNEKEEPKKSVPSKPPELSEVMLDLLVKHGHRFSQLNDNETLTLVLTVREDKRTARKLSKKDLEEHPGLDQKLRELEAVGDLHQRQGKYDEAIAIFLRMLEVAPETKQEAALRRKLAQCYLAQHKYEPAAKELEAVLALSKKEKDEKEKPAGQSAPELPAKLIISASKKMLVEAQEGQIKPIEFKRRGKVRWLKFDERRP